MLFSTFRRSKGTAGPIIRISPEVKAIRGVQTITGGVTPYCNGFAEQFERRRLTVLSSGPSDRKLSNPTDETALGC